MGACHNLSRTKAIIKANIQENNKNNIISDLASKNSINSKLNIKNDSSHSNISSNTTSTQINQNQKSNLNQYFFYLPATLGEIEVPILVERNEKIIIKLNQNNNNTKNILWSFFPNENPVNYLGYNNYKYNNENVGSLFLRISGDNKIYHLNKIDNHIIANDKGYLLFFANLNKNDYPIYQPKGSLLIIVYGGNYNVDNELYHSNNINAFSNKNKINLEDKKEYKILDYINKVRHNPKKFYLSYFSINEEINLDLKEFIYKISKRNELKICNELNKLAKIHCEDLCDNETAGFIGTNGFDLNYEMKKNNIICKTYGESIIYNINNPLLIVKNIMQDIYSKKKKNRENLFFDKFNKVGIYLKEHPIYKYCCVLIFSD